MKDQRFTLTEEHLTLLQRAYVRWEDCEFGAPAIDCKRPYGNSGVVADMCDILGIDYDEDEGPDRATAERLTALHRETQKALQIVLCTRTFVPGEYVAGAYSSLWKRA